MADRRTAHPYYVYEAVHDQPALIEAVLAQGAAIERAGDAAAEKERVIFVGIGTSLHAAQIAEIWLREFTGGRIWAHFEQSFEFLHHPVAMGREDAVMVITHTGSSSASAEALRVARAAGALTIAITGQNSAEAIRGADFQIETCGQEIAFAYTKSYTTALAALALINLRIAKSRNLLARENFHAELSSVPALMQQALGLEVQTRELAKRIASRERVEIFGAGSGWATAREAALKIKESCYMAAEGFETEEVLHGPFSEVDSRTALVGLLSGTRSDDRARQIFRAASEVKALRAAVTVPSANRDLAAEDVLLVPECAEWLQAFVHLAPLQLLNYFLALERGTSPDSGRQEQELHAAASKHYKY
ncbi:MAG: SIS domain-containing protein [Candidatus Acidiferrales bacterium]